MGKQSWVKRTGCPSRISTLPPGRAMLLLLVISGLEGCSVHGERGSAAEESRSESCPCGVGQVKSHQRSRKKKMEGSACAPGRMSLTQVHLSGNGSAR